MATKTRAALHTPLCDLLGIRYPICQAGMGWVARSSLAAAVSEAGELGAIAAAVPRKRLGHGRP
jgi:NAD(P)H-dependent flavin oxidoreductase YrpB (nitropropane dioxygenase family)